MYVKLTSTGEIEKYPYSIDELRKINTQVSFPENPNHDVLAKWNVFPVRGKNPPKTDYATQDCIRVNPTLHGEVWIETWEIRDLTEEEKAKRTENQAIEVRGTRDSLLQINVDNLSPVRWELLTEEKKQTVLNYRQLLLDVPQQEGFPWEVVWPEPPSL